MEDFQYDGVALAPHFPVDDLSNASVISKWLLLGDDLLPVLAELANIEESTSIHIRDLRSSNFVGIASSQHECVDLYTYRVIADPFSLPRDRQFGHAWSSDNPLPRRFDKKLQVRDITYCIFGRATGIPFRVVYRGIKSCTICAPSLSGPIHSEFKSTLSRVEEAGLLDFLRTSIVDPCLDQEFKYRASRCLAKYHPNYANCFAHELVDSWTEKSDVELENLWDKGWIWDRPAIELIDKLDISATSTAISKTLPLVEFLEGSRETRQIRNALNNIERAESRPALGIIEISTLVSEVARFSEHNGRELITKLLERVHRDSVSRELELAVRLTLIFRAGEVSWVKELANPESGLYRRIVTYPETRKRVEFWVNRVFEHK